MHLSVSLMKRLLSVSNLVNRKNKIVIACMPKTASTFLQYVLADLGGLPIKDVCAPYGDGSEQDDLELPAVVDASFGGFVTHMHTRGTLNNVKLMKMAGIKPVILTRNIFDITVSIRDQADKLGLLRWPMVRFVESFRELDRTTQFDYVIDLCLPWFFSFHALWSGVEKEDDLKVHWLTYETFMVDKPAAVHAMCGFCGIKATREEATAVIDRLEGDRRKYNYNVGKVGRGADQLSEAQQRRIVRFASYYPGVDFTRLGL